MKTEPIIFFEKFSFLKFISLLHMIRKDGKLFVLNASPLTKCDPEENYAMSLVKFFLPDVEVSFFGHPDVPEVLFTSRYALPAFIEKKDEVIKDSKFSRVLMKLYNDIGIVKGIKQSILLTLRKTWYFRHVAEQLSKRYKSPLMIVPEWSDQFAIFEDCSFLCLPRRIILINYLKNIYGVTKTIMVFLYILFGNIMKVTRIKTSHAKYAIQVLHGGFVDNQNCDVGQRRKRFDSRFLEDGKDFSPQNILYVFGTWSYPFEKLKRWLRSITEKNGKYFFENNPPPDITHICTVQLWKYGRALLSSMALLVVRWNCWILAQAALLLLVKINRYEIFCKYYRIDSFLGFDDYATQHIARTIVFNKYGIKNVGMAHSNQVGLYLMPELIYIYFNQYLVFGNMIRMRYAPYWQDQPILEVGLLHADYIFQSINDKTREREFRVKYPSKYNVTLMWGGYHKQNLEHRKLEYYNGIAEMIERYPQIKVILKPRMVSDGRFLDKNAEKILGKYINSGKITIEFNDFDKSELIAYSDLIISFNTSTSIAESLCAGKKAFCYICSGIDKFSPFKQLDSRLQANNKEDFLMLVHYYLFNKESDKLSWEAYRQLGLIYGGKGCSRIRNALRTHIL
jgi:hypothetical protein